MCQEVPILPRNTLNLYLLFLEMIFNSVVLLVTAYSAAQGFCIQPDLGPVSSAELSLSGYSRERSQFDKSFPCTAISRAVRKSHSTTLLRFLFTWLSINLREMWLTWICWQNQHLKACQLYSHDTLNLIMVCMCRFICFYSTSSGLKNNKSHWIKK